MRFMLADAVPLTVDAFVIWHIYPGGYDFDVAAFRGWGYTHLEVITIGAAGGRGGSYFTGTSVEGGGGGGGGCFHRKQIALSALPASVPVLVGEAGAEGTDDFSSGGADNLTAGGSGGHSLFYTAEFSVASGGKGGDRPTGDGAANPPVGGEGGIGGRVAPGGGGLPPAGWGSDGLAGDYGPDDSGTGIHGSGGSGGSGGSWVTTPGSGGTNPGDGGPGGGSPPADTYSAGGIALAPGSPVGGWSAPPDQPPIPGDVNFYAVGGIGGGACVDGLTGAGELYGGGAGSPDGAVIVRVTRII